MLSHTRPTYSEKILSSFNQLMFLWSTRMNTYFRPQLHAVTRHTPGQLTARKFLAHLIN